MVKARPLTLVALAFMTMAAPALAGKYNRTEPSAQWATEGSAATVERHSREPRPDREANAAHPNAEDAAMEGFRRMSAADLAADLAGQIRDREAERIAIIAARRAAAIARWQEEMRGRSHGGHPIEMRDHTEHDGTRTKRGVTAKPDPIDQSRFGAAGS